jgi:hypothetical protein
MTSHEASPAADIPQPAIKSALRSNNGPNQVRMDSTSLQRNLSPRRTQKKDRKKTDILLGRNQTFDELEQHLKELPSSDPATNRFLSDYQWFKTKGFGYDLFESLVFYTTYDPESGTLTTRPPSFNALPNITTFSQCLNTLRRELKPCSKGYLRIW